MTLRFSLANAPRPAVLRLLVPCLLALGACRARTEPKPEDPVADDSVEEVSPPDIAKTAFQANVTQPTVVTLTPSNETTNASTDVNVEVVFNVDMAPDGLANAIQVTVAGLAIPGTTSYDPALKKLTFDPTNPLPPNSVVMVTLAETPSVAGHLSTGAFWTFTTGS